jgi:hypothetical protein
MKSASDSHIFFHRLANPRAKTIFIMFKIIVFILFFAPMSLDLSALPTTTANDCACPTVSNVQKTGSTSHSLSYAWTGSGQANQYKIWYVRKSDGYTSADFYTSTNSYTFSNLQAGQYTFYFVAICGTESSDFIGVEDILVL